MLIMFSSKVINSGHIAQTRYNNIVHQIDQSEKFDLLKVQILQFKVCNSQPLTYIKCSFWTNHFLDSS